MRLPAPISFPVSQKIRCLQQALVIERDGWKIEIIQGFCSDGSSKPRLTWRIMGHPWDGLTEAPAWVHDGLYQSGLVPRDVADRVYLILSEVNNVNKAKRKIEYRTLRLAGWRAHSKTTPESRESARQYVRITNLDKLLEIAK